MTNTLTLRSLDLPAITRFGVGFESLFDDLIRKTEYQNNQTYPPYNLIQKDADNFLIELALAGFREDDIDVQLESNQLSITGEKIKDLEEKEAKPEYIVRGISSKSFVRKFTLAEHIQVQSASFVDGILSVALTRIVPDEKKPRKILLSK
jgi:molecular chaperone IbpA